MRILLTLLILIAGFSETAMAQNNSYISAFEQLIRINNNQSGQNTKYVPSKKILTGRILDSTNRVVGEMRDVLLDQNGVILMLDINFNRLNLGVDSLAVNYRKFGVRPATNGYKLERTDNQIAAALPDLLAATETAAGKDTQRLSIKHITGRKLYSKNGKKLGKVEEILFDSTRQRAKLLQISVTQRLLGSKKMLIPFDGPSYDRKKVIVPNEMADAIIAYAKGK